MSPSKAAQNLIGGFAPEPVELTDQVLCGGVWSGNGSRSAIAALSQWLRSWR